jgi:hypothetical protein
MNLVMDSPPTAEPEPAPKPRSSSGKSANTK